MFGQLKDRFLSLQEEISSSVKQLGSSEVSSGPPASKNELEAGAALLETWQDNWEVLHVASEKNAKAASRCDKLITKLKDRSQMQWNHVTTLHSNIPKVNQGIAEIMEKLGCLESVLGDVEISLLALEDTIDAREMQEKQLDQRFQLAMYQERRKAEFNELATRLQNDYEKKKKAAAKKQIESKQQYYQRKFDEDLEKYKSSAGSSTMNPHGAVHLQVPKRPDPDASLESVDLDEPEPEYEENQNLEQFLNSNETDALYDVSPLPRDETPLQKTDAVGEVVNEVPINVISAGSSPTTGTITPPTGAITSPTESVYCTPDMTTEKLSEISLN